MQKTSIQNYINHIALVVDASSSMEPHRRTLPQVFDNEITYLKQRSVELNQETRVSVYVFSDNVRCLVFDMDVMRMPSLAEYYQPNGMTALLDGTAKAIEDMRKLPELYGDHAFLVYVLTDGEENRSRLRSTEFCTMVDRLAEHWTLACMVPDARATHEAKKFGFPPGSVMTWDTSSRQGLEAVGGSFRSAVSTYMDNRSKGIRGTKSFFANTANLRQSDVQKTLKEVTPGSVRVYPVNRDEEIRAFIERETGRLYQSGCAFYELAKSEKVQHYKQIALKHKISGKIYSGAEARQLLGIPDNTEIRLRPGDNGDYKIFIQSTSINRKLIAGTEVLVQL